MFERFAASFTPDEHSLPGPHKAGPLPDGLVDVPGAEELIRRFGGMSFNRGLYRILPIEHMDRWNQVAWETWPKLDHRFWVIAIDWMGCLYGIDYSVLDERGWCMSALEPYSGRGGEFGDDLVEFHDVSLVASTTTNGAVLSEWHAEWLEFGGTEPTFDQCVGLKVPYFLGGSDYVSDFELSDLDVYWHLSSQLIRWARTVPKDKWENGVITIPVNITIH